jgi:3-hydroxyacyl-CoA dehydrogenase
MVSATFGNEMWSTQGAGLSRVKKAIQVRSGATVRLVVQNKDEMKKAQKAASQSEEKKLERFLAEQQKRDSLLKELNTEKKAAVSGGFGLFKKNFGIWGAEEEGL